ncbi:S-layer homology domain-containing protein [uncultured Flavonifractor sp.]|uniref:S-layer homology domain-containing protein n=1 Tax=uncultured Flavonifractor sp. TaxID=1193534 RepID=UPI00263A13BA|nr:S-layer homology domain-containing protein [uncultured Flavonifractor sp.]
MRKLSLFFLTLCLTAAALIPGAAAAGGPRLTVSSQEPASSQSIGFTGLPADCHSIQATFTLSADASCDFAPDSVLAGQPGVYTAFKQTGRAVTVYVTAKSGVLPTDGALTLGVLSSPDTLFTVEQASNLKLLTSDGEETTYPSVDTGSNGSGSSGGSGGSNSSGGNSGGVAWASANGIVTGYSNGSFGPDDTITREQMAAILYRYARYKGYDLSARTDLSGYTDAGQVSAYATDPMTWAVGSGLITGTSGTTLSPAGSATRAQAAVILARFCQNIVA